MRKWLNRFLSRNFNKDAVKVNRIEVIDKTSLGKHRIFSRASINDQTVTQDSKANLAPLDTRDLSVTFELIEKGDTLQVAIS